MTAQTDQQTYRLSTEAAELYEARFVPALFGPWAERLARAAGAAPEDRVVDVACGTGIVARTIAGRRDRDTGTAGGRITGVDANPAVLAVARRLRPDLTWVEGDAAALPVPSASAELVTCQAALMFFPDRVAALREMARVAVPGGRVVLQVPGRLAHSPGYAALVEIVGRHVGAEGRRLLSGYFAAGDPDRLRADLAQAGLVVERFDSWTGATRLGSVDDFLDVELLPITDRVSPEVRDRIVTDCRTALRPFTSPDGAIAAPIEAHLFTASVGP